MQMEVSKRYKARFVVKRFTQVEGLYFHEPFPRVAKQSRSHHLRGGGSDRQGGELRRSNLGWSKLGTTKDIAKIETVKVGTAEVGTAKLQAQTVGDLELEEIGTGRTRRLAEQEEIAEASSLDRRRFGGLLD
ncbi:hypothetical protein CRG98_009493 [Punica granatum]|uniref:Uncharacterized protein n=1 Tax=Punica granatum TaxID=22663 RepID=A0A2I0KNQ5_PUNGR|nr:hypothetical protein CRG98_009493 [Punica granatum]